MEKMKQVLFRAPLLTAAAACFLIAAIVFLFFSNEQTTVKGVAQKQQPTPSITLTPTEVEEVFGSQDTADATSFISPTTAQTIEQTATQQVPTATAVPQPTSVPAKQTFEVGLSINGASVGNVTLEEGANQCDVLTKAKDQGKISQLLMKYDTSLGTNGVYQINGIGKENTVWWVYKVNGTSPSQGCSYIKATNGDKVEWEYKG